MRGVLFDLDGTLLDIDLEGFLGRYFRALSSVVAPLVDSPEDEQRAMRAVMESTNAMMRPHPGVTNHDIFHDEYRRLTGLDLREHWQLFEDFYENEFPLLGDGYGPRDGARTVLEAAKGCHLGIAIATNPIFPLRAVEHRLAWAGLEGSLADVVTSYESMHACKPHPDYFRETAAQLGLDPRDCLMVGDDSVLDMSAADVGMSTFYVGDAEDVQADYHGTLLEAADLIMRVCAEGGDVSL
ncbi:MAG: HAD family hydrolase [Actinomycetota bacterium]|nr:HAD family hydrolase [Actinomycetota bacterium]